MEPVYFSKLLELISKVRRASAQLNIQRFHSLYLELLISLTEIAESFLLRFLCTWSDVGPYFRSEAPQRRSPGGQV